jgi:Protein of unknown function (DUF3987)
MTPHHIDFHRINQVALRNARSLLPAILPGGKFRSSEYIAINPNRADKNPGSFSVNYKSGIWRDFATEEGGGDLISLVAYPQGTGQGEAAHRLADMLAVALPKQRESSHQNGGYASQRESGAPNVLDAPKIYPGGEEGPRPFAREARRHIYRDGNGKAVRIKIKFLSGKYANIYRVEGSGPSVAWQPKRPDGYLPTPYMSSSLNPFDPELSADQLLWTEGEKDTDTLDKAGLPAFTFGGTGDGLTDDVKQVVADRALLSNRDVVVLADNDKAGRIHADKKARFAHSAGAVSIKTIHFPELPEKGDVSDYFAVGGTAETFTALIRNAEQWSPVDKNREASSVTLEEARPNAQRQWPELDDAALHGLAGDVVRLLNPHTEADPVGVLVQFLTAFGNIIGSNPYYQVESDRHRANLFSVHVGASAKGRKGTAGGRVRAITRCADEMWSNERTASGLSSGEGLINAVRDQVLKWDAKAKQFETVDPGIVDKRLMITEPEFAGALSAMERHGNTLSPVIRNAWDGQKLQTLTKASPLKATGAHISIIAHITEEETRARLTRTEMANGFANRFLFCCVKRSKLLPHGGALPEAELVGLARRVKTAVEFARQVGRVGMTAEAAEAWAAAYPELSAERPGLVGAIIARAEAQVIRLSLVFALLDMRDTIAPEHLEAAMAVWAYCEASALRIFRDSLGDPVADDILRALRQSGPGGMTRTEIYNLFSRHRASDQIGAALQLLRSKGKVRSQTRETRGRPSEVWVAVGGAS